MDCPFCQKSTYVLATRADSSGQLHRRRKCENGHRFTTYEVLKEDKALLVNMAKVVEDYLERKRKGKQK